MDIQTFTASLEEIRSFPRSILEHLRESAPNLPEAIREKIIDDLRQSEQRQWRILEEGLADLQGLERRMKAAVRVKNEREESTDLPSPPT